MFLTYTRKIFAAQKTTSICHFTRTQRRRAPPVDGEIAKATGELLSGSSVGLEDRVIVRQTSQVEAVARRSSARRERFTINIVYVDRQAEMKRSRGYCQKQNVIT